VVNDNIKPVTDMDHYGMIRWWRYPDDGAWHSHALPSAACSCRQDGRGGLEIEAGLRA
jgi:predicted transglutaminase-like cysteine proteinase